jgi:large subunit ribosomal protein L21
MAEKTLKKAVIMTGGKQYLVKEGDELTVELLAPAKSTSFEALLLIEGEKISVGTPMVKDVMVNADIIEQLVKAEKVTAIRYKAKKRVHKRKGHRQKLTKIKIKSIS